MTVELHIGYVGITREGKRVKIVRSDDDRWPPYNWASDNGNTYMGDGLCFKYTESRHDIIGPWVDPETQELGPWIGWNGGECPVHPDTVVQAVRGTSEDADCETWPAGQFQKSNWSDMGGTHSIIAYRIIKEHKEPREMWLKYDSLDVWLECTKSDEGAVLFREVKE